MEFFKQLSEVGVSKLELQVVIKNETISVIITPELKNVKAIPLTVSGTAEELDEGFFDVITKPLQKAGGLTSNVEDFEKSLEDKPAAAATTKSDAGSGTVKTPPAGKAKAEKKPAPYKHQKYLDAILAIVNTEGYVLTEENKPVLQDAVDKLLVMDSKNEIALDWNKKIKDLTPKVDVSEEKPVEEKTEAAKKDVPEPDKKSEEIPPANKKAEETKVEEKSDKKVAAPPAPEKEETTSEESEEQFFDDEDLDLDFEDFFTE